MSDPEAQKMERLAGFLAGRGIGVTPGEERIWRCKIGGRTDPDRFPDAADFPMRQAVEAVFKEITGSEAEFTFSGWGAELTESERAVVEDRLPVEERIDHEAGKAVVEKLRVWAARNQGYKLTAQEARTILALLTEHSACREALRAYANAYPCPGIEVEPGLTSGCDGSGGDCPTCAALTTPESTGIGTAWRRNVENTFPPVEAEEEG